MTCALHPTWLHDPDDCPFCVAVAQTRWAYLATVDDNVRDLTDEERLSLRFLHKERGDLARYAGWQNLQPILARHHPELLKAYSDVIIAQRILDALVDDL